MDHLGIVSTMCDEILDRCYDYGCDSLFSKCDAKEALGLIEKKLKYHKTGQASIAQKSVKTGRRRPKK